jgi:hypothetical protein
LLSPCEFAPITGVALIVSRFWNERIDKVVNLVIAPMLIGVGIRFLIEVFAWGRPFAILETSTPFRIVPSAAFPSEPGDLYSKYL